MKLIKKIAIGAVIATTAAICIIPAKPKENQKKEQVTLELERTINFNNPQKTLNEAFNLCKPENLSEVIYDPDFKRSDDYIKNRFVRHSRRLLGEYIQQARTGSPGHDICVADILEDVGNGKKREAFARKSLIDSRGVLCQEDLESCIYHENIHAGEARYGYDFGDSILKGRELKRLFDRGEIRPQTIIDIGEFDAYAAQLARADNTERKPSIVHKTFTKITVFEIYNKLNANLQVGALSPMERRYFEAKKRKHEKVIETLKTFNSKN